MADRFRIKVQVVRDLMKNIIKKNSCIVKKREVEVRNFRQRAAVNYIISQNLNQKQVIWSSKAIQA